MSTVSDSAAPDPAARPAHPQPVVTNRILTIPNVLSFLRLLGVPLFLYLIIVPQGDGWAFVVLVVSAITDYADGKLARLLNQYTSWGRCSTRPRTGCTSSRRWSASSSAGSSPGGWPP